MAVTLDSSRFGPLQVPDEALIEFPCGLVGLPNRRFALVAKGPEATFLWLHSTDDPDLAIPVTNPYRFFDAYEVELSEDDSARVDISQKTSIYVTVRAGETLEDFSVNLRAPLLVSGGRGHQVINQAPDAPVRAPLFGDSADSTRAA